MFDGPIAGQSLTAELGSRPWQNPPKLKTAEEAIEYYLPKLTNPDRLPTLLNMIEYVIGTEKQDDSDLVDPTSIILAIKKANKKLGIKEEPKAVEAETPVPEDTMSEPPAGGLMSRRA